MAGTTAIVTVLLGVCAVALVLGLAALTTRARVAIAKIDAKK